MARRLNGTLPDGFVPEKRLRIAVEICGGGEEVSSIGAPSCCEKERENPLATTPSRLQILPSEYIHLVAARVWGGAECHTVGLSRTVAARTHSVRTVELGCDTYAEFLKRSR